MSNYHLNQNQLSRVDLPFEPAEWFPELDLLQESGEINTVSYTHLTLPTKA